MSFEYARDALTIFSIYFRLNVDKVKDSIGTYIRIFRYIKVILNFFDYYIVISASTNENTRYLNHNLLILSIYLEYYTRG